MNLIYSTRKDPHVQNIQKNKNTYTLLDFDTQIFKHFYNFEFIIIVRSKVLDLTII